MKRTFDWIETARRCFANDAVWYSGHARREMMLEQLGAIREEEIFEAIQECEIITDYPEDKPYPSVLLLGMTNARRPLHLVCAYDSEGNRVIVVTVYQPDSQLWDNFRRRK